MKAVFTDFGVFSTVMIEKIPASSLRVMVVGGYGLIGGATMRQLKSAGHRVIGVGRDLQVARRRLPGFDWARADLRLTRAAEWAGLLEGVDAVVNAAGVLQDGLGDDLAAVHVQGLERLIAGCHAAGVGRLVHVSAVGVTPGRGGGFNETKAQGEAVVRASGLAWTILRPALVLGPEAYGGTALLRGLAAFPWIIPAVAAQSPVQAVSVRVVADAAVAAVEGRAGNAAALEFAGADRLPLAEVLTQLRAWLGLPPAPVIDVPRPLIGLTSAVADVLGRLGWRSAMRSSAVQQQALGMHSPGGGEAVLGLPTQALAEILESMPASLQERRFARLYFVKPTILILLAAFCAYSGLLGLTGGRAAALAMFAAGGVKPPISDGLLGAGCAADLMIAVGLTLRRWAPLALKALILMSLVYLSVGTVLRPDLWLDPLAALPKAAPVAMLALAALAMMDDR